MYAIAVSDTEIARHAGYIYVLFAPRFAAAYVGQTRASEGALRRLNQHIGFGANATFRTRLAEHFSYDEVDIGPVMFEAYRLDSNPGYHGRPRDEREAVEALTQFDLLNRLAADSLASCVVISRVTLNPYAQAEHVRAMSELVTDHVYARACEVRASSTWGNC